MKKGLIVHRPAFKEKRQLRDIQVMPIVESLAGKF